MRKKPFNPPTGVIDTNVGLTVDGVMIALERQADGSYRVIEPAPDALVGRTATLVTVVINGLSVKRWKVS